MIRRARRSRLVAGAALLASMAASFVNPAVAQDRPDLAIVYGEDDRRDIYQVSDQRKLKLAESTVALFKAGEVSAEPGGKTVSLRTESYAEKYNLCQDEPFRDQKVGGFCSGALVASDMIMTAGHCVEDEAGCKETKFVFGFTVSRDGASAPDRLPASEVYGCAGIVGRELDQKGADWALLRLDRPVKNHAPLAVRRGTGPRQGIPIFDIAHPSGLPTKIGGGAEVRGSAPAYFDANLDTFPGSSGGPVFNAATGEIEGVNSRGFIVNYVLYEKENCYRSAKVANENGWQSVTDVSVLSGLIPTKHPAAARKVSASGQAYSSLVKVAERGFQ